MDRSDHYLYVQQNLALLEQQIKLVKKATQIAIGKHAWQEVNHYDVHQLEASQKEILAGTRLYTFLVCSWLEARITKVFYENSSVAFTDSEINTIMYSDVSRRRKRTMEQIWKLSFSAAVQKSYGFSAHTGVVYDYSSEFPAESTGLLNYQTILGLFSDITEAITVRNRLAHGQWYVQFNSSNTAVEHYALLTKYDNIQKLGHLKDYFDQIGEIISMYVVYKDKRNANFDNIVAKRIQLIVDKKFKADCMDYAKYVAQLRRNYEAQRDRNKREIQSDS